MTHTKNTHKIIRTLTQIADRLEAYRGNLDSNILNTKALDSVFENFGYCYEWMKRHNYCNDIGEKSLEELRAEICNRSLQCFCNVENSDNPGENYIHLSANVHKMIEKLRLKARLVEEEAELHKADVPKVDTSGDKDSYNTNEPKYLRIREWAEDYIKKNCNNSPQGFNALLRLVQAQFNTCGTKTLQNAIKGSPYLETWKKKTEEWARNKKYANKQSDVCSLDEDILDSDGPTTLGETVEGTTTSPADAADFNERIERLCAKSLEDLLKKVKGTFFYSVKWQNDLDGTSLKPEAKWKKLEASLDMKDKKSLAQMYLTLEEQIKDILSRTPNAANDPRKRKFMNKPKL